MDRERVCVRESVRKRERERERERERKRNVNRKELSGREKWGFRESETGDKLNGSRQT